MTHVCPCRMGTKNSETYQSCCERFHNGVAAENAEQLMRSRYSAFVLELAPYLIDTWHISTRPEQINFDEEPKQKWLGLQIKKFEQTSDIEAFVEFVARYTIGGRAYRLHEKSRFLKQENRWLYVDGIFE